MLIRPLQKLHLLIVFTFNSVKIHIIDGFIIFTFSQRKPVELSNLSSKLMWIPGGSSELQKTQLDMNVAAVEESVG